MAKKPSEPTPVIPKASKKTKDAIAFFEGKKSGVDLLEKEDGRKTRKFKPSNHVKTANEKFWDFIEDRKVGSILVLALTTAAVSYAVYWVMHQ